MEHPELPIENQSDILKQVKSLLNKKKILHRQSFNGYEFDNPVEWILITNHSNLGDLFSRPLYDFDSLLYEHTYKTFQLLEKELELPAYYKLKCTLFKIPEFKRK
jgi:hypothetical protein